MRNGLRFQPSSGTPFTGWSREGRWFGPELVSRRGQVVYVDVALAMDGVRKRQEALRAARMAQGLEIPVFLEKAV